MNNNFYVVKSLELHLFFGRIMKEHALFLKAGFTPADPSFSDKAEFYLNEFERLLCEVVSLSNGIVGKEVLESGEVITEFTALAEEQTQCFTGIPIDQEITAKTLDLKCMESQRGSTTQLSGKVRRLNRTGLKLVDGLIGFKEDILKCVLRCDMFTTNYPLLIEHMLREANLYRRCIEILEREGDLREQTMKETERFWNQIMMEHAQFIRGQLDPCETELYCKADGFAKQYCRLLGTSGNACTLTEESLAQTLQFRDFKAAGTQGIQQCKIRSVILPLLADHVLREANHYLRLLQPKCS